MMPIYGKTNPLELDEGIKRYGSVIGLKPEMEARYRELHANAWQSIQGRLTASNVCNYSIFIADLKVKSICLAILSIEAVIMKRICH